MSAHPPAEGKVVGHIGPKSPEEELHDAIKLYKSTAEDIQRRRGEAMEHWGLTYHLSKEMMKKKHGGKFSLDDLRSDESKRLDWVKTNLLLYMTQHPQNPYMHVDPGKLEKAIMAHKIGDSSHEATELNRLVEAELGTSLDDLYLTVAQQIEDGHYTGPDSHLELFKSMYDERSKSRVGGAQRNLRGKLNNEKALEAASKLRGIKHKKMDPDTAFKQLVRYISSETGNERLKEYFGDHKHAA